MLKVEKQEFLAQSDEICLEKISLLPLHSLMLARPCLRWWSKMRTNENRGFTRASANYQSHLAISSRSRIVLDPAKRFIECTAEHALHLA